MLAAALMAGAAGPALLAQSPAGDMTMKGKTVFITGSTDGLGRFLLPRHQP
jgi:hypothetical protein